MLNGGSMLLYLGIAIVVLQVIIAFELYVLADHGIAEILLAIGQATNSIVQALAKR
jgi:hypothetical protein